MTEDKILLRNLETCFESIKLNHQELQSKEMTTEESAKINENNRVLFAQAEEISARLEKLPEQREKQK
ncbi:hypothetical protein [Cohaesibacter haloalkalitolerans]|uniref:hypothetical protein n=1 Tax=Cohaesibacter haloalkalitolerans TaxID=1162980 RepID=UPI000E657528|nr:hypothetical protein [Cohaesibacter haloalkalitolerans]